MHLSGAEVKKRRCRRVTGARVTGDATLDGVDRKSSLMRCHLNKEGSEEFMVIFVTYLSDIGKSIIKFFCMASS